MSSSDILSSTWELDDFEGVWQLKNDETSHGIHVTKGSISWDSHYRRKGLLPLHWKLKLNQARRKWFIHSTHDDSCIGWYLADCTQTPDQTQLLFKNNNSPTHFTLTRDEEGEESSSSEEEEISVPQKSERKTDYFLRILVHLSLITFLLLIHFHDIYGPIHGYLYSFDSPSMISFDSYFEVYTKAHEKSIIDTCHLVMSLLCFCIFVYSPFTTVSMIFGVLCSYSVYALFHPFEYVHLAQVVMLVFVSLLSAKSLNIVRRVSVVLMFCAVAVLFDLYFVSDGDVKWDIWRQMYENIAYFIGAYGKYSCIVWQQMLKEWGSWSAVQPLRSQFELLSQGFSALWNDI